MPAANSLRLCAAAGALLVAACTYNYDNRIEHPPHPPATAAADRCSLAWSGVAPSGWRVRELRGFVSAIPGSGCPAMELRVHRSGLPVSWDTNLDDTSSDWVVRSALTQYTRTPDGPLLRIHAFAEPVGLPDPNMADGRNSSGDDDSGQNGGQSSPGLTPSGDTPAGDRAPPDPPGPAGPKDPNPPTPTPPPIVPGPSPPPAEESGSEPGDVRDPGVGPSAWVARNAPPALVGGGVVYGLVYLNLLGIPAAGRIAPQAAAGQLRGRGRRPEEEAAEEAAVVLGEPGPAADRRVRIRSSGFEGPQA
jgi:hypothetical protein